MTWDDEEDEDPEADDVQEQDAPEHHLGATPLPRGQRSPDPLEPTEICRKFRRCQNKPSPPIGGHPSEALSEPITDASGSQVGREVLASSPSWSRLRVCASC